MARRISSILTTALVAGAIGFGAGVYLVPNERAEQFRFAVEDGVGAISRLTHFDKPNSDNQPSASQSTTSLRRRPATEREVAAGAQVDATASGSMRHFLYAFLIALANNVDNIGARIAYSIQGTKINALINLWISIITFVISSVAAFSGTMVTGSFGTKVAAVIAMGLLVTLGFWMILEARKQHWRGKNSPRENSTSIWTILLRPEHADTDDSKHIDFKEGTVLGIALSINNIAGGLSAGIIGLNPLLVGFLSAVLSFAALWAGNYVADWFIRRHIADKAAVVGGILLIAIGIKQVVG